MINSHPGKPWTRDTLSEYAAADEGSFQKKYDESAKLTRAEIARQSF